MTYTTALAAVKAHLGPAYVAVIKDHIETTAYRAGFKAGNAQVRDACQSIAREKIKTQRLEREVAELRTQISEGRKDAETRRALWAPQHA